MKYLIIKKVGKIFTFTESSNGVLEDGVFYSGNALSMSAYNSEIYIINAKDKSAYFLADVRYKTVTHTTFASLFNELTTDGFTGNFKSAEVTAVQMGVENITTLALSSAQLTALYPLANTGFKVYCTGITLGKMTYEKTPSGWIGYTVLIP